MFRRSKIKHTPKLPTSSKPVIQLNKDNSNTNITGETINNKCDANTVPLITDDHLAGSSGQNLSPPPPSQPPIVQPNVSIVTNPSEICTTIVVTEKPNNNNIISNESQCEPMQLDDGDNVSPIISSSSIIPSLSPQPQPSPIQSSTTTYLSTPPQSTTDNCVPEIPMVVVVDTGPPSVSIPIEVNNNTIPNINNQATDPPQSSSSPSTTTTTIKTPQAKCHAKKSVPPTHSVSSSSTSSPSSTSCVTTNKDVIDHDKRTIFYLIRNPISSNRRGRKRIKKITDKTTKSSPPSDDDGENTCSSTSTSTSTTCSSNKKHTNGNDNNGKDKVNPSPSPSSSTSTTTGELNIYNHDSSNSQQQSQTRSVGPRVKVAPDGSIVLDEESLVIKKPKDVRETIVENSLNGKVTYSSFREKPRTARWTKDETLKFYTALKLIGPDFSIMAKLFFSGTRSRTDLKNKFRRETKLNKSVIENTLYEVGHDYGLAQEAFENELFS